MKFAKIVFILAMVGVLCNPMLVLSMQRVKKMMGQMQEQPAQKDPSEGTKDIWDAINNRSVNAVKYWLEQGVDMEIKHEVTGDTPLLYAAGTCGGTPIVKFLIGRGADIEAKDNKGKTALVSVVKHAVLFGKADFIFCHWFDTLNALIRAGANIDMADAEGNTILMYFANINDLHSVKTLVSRHANIEAKNQIGRTALMHAAERGYLDIVKYLVEHKANIEVEDISGNTALRLAARKGALDVVKYLLKQQAKIDDISLLELVFKYNDLALYQLLLDRGFDLHQQNEQGENLLMRALARRDLKAASLLVGLGIDPYQKDNKGFNAFDYAQNDPEVLAILNQTTRKERGKKEEPVVETSEGDTAKAIRRLQHIQRAMNPESPKVTGQEVKTAAADLSQQTGLTPTEAHWKRFGQLIEKKYGKVLDDPLVKRILVREKDAVAQGKYVLYRAEPGKYRVYQDFLEELYRLVYLYSKKNEFVLNRFFKDAAKEHTINEYIDTMQSRAHKMGPEYNVLLSANIALFGNVANSGSCTWDYFQKNFAAEKIDLKPLFKRIFDKYGFDEKYIDQLLALHEGLLEQSATLQQIIIPKNIVNDVAMFATHGYCFPWEYPVDEGQADSCWDAHAISVKEDSSPTKGRYTCISSIIDKYRDGRITIHDAMQARILMDAVYGLNPDSGIEIYQYTRLPEKKLLHFKNQVKKITDEMFAAWLKEMLSKKEVSESLKGEKLGDVLQHLGKGKSKL